jgi:YVTN family beta-propeller protein
MAGLAGRRAAADPQGIAVTPGGRTAYVTNTGSGTVPPVDTASRRWHGVRGEHDLQHGDAGQHPDRPRRSAAPGGVYTYPTVITLAPSGHTATVVGSYAGKVTLIDTRTRKATAHITVGAYPVVAAVAR